MAKYRSLTGDILKRLNVFFDSILAGNIFLILVSKNALFSNNTPNVICVFKRSSQNTNRIPG